MNSVGNFQWDSSYPNSQVFESDIATNQLWVAELYGNIAGIAAITTNQEPEYANADWDITERAIVIHRLAVDPDYQGRGVAAALLEQAEKVAAGHGIHVLRVDTNSNNQATQILFPKAGYKYAGSISLTFRPGMQFYCYEKRI